MKWIKARVYYLKSIVKITAHFKGWLRLLPLFLGIASSEERIVQLRQPPVRMAVRGAMDVWSIKETFLDAFYTHYGVPVQDGWRVIDIGSGIGDFSLYAAYGKPHAKILAYEPFPESYRLLLKNLALNNIQNVDAVQKAIWSEEGALTLDLSVGEPLRITSTNIKTSREDDGKLTVQALPLEGVLEVHHLERVDLLKLDCEGAEYEILIGAPFSVLVKIDRIIMEYHDLDENHNHQSLISFLQDVGYCVSAHKNVVHDDIGYLYAFRGSE